MQNKFRLIFIKSGFKFKAAAGLLALFFVASNFLPFFQFPAFAKQANNSFTVQLSSPGYLGKLKKVATGISHLFGQNSLPQFQNVYSFQSSGSIVFLQNYLKGDFIYLEQNLSLQEEGIFVNDPGFSQDPQNTDKQWGLTKAGFSDAWQKTIGSRNNMVAVI